MLFDWNLNSEKHWTDLEKLEKTYLSSAKIQLFCLIEDEHHVDIYCFKGPIN